MQGSARFLVPILVASILCDSSGAADAKRDLFDFCLDLARKLALVKETDTNAEVAFREAQKYMKSIFGPIPKLARAWEAVIRDEQCGKQSADYVAIINDCRPRKKGSLATLYAAVKRYSNQCLTPAFWDEQLHKTFGKSGDKSGMTDLIDARFLEKYRKDNPNEPPLRFAHVRGQNCCRPDRSQGALFQAMGADTDEAKLRIVRADRDVLESLFKRQLFKPCERYLRTVAGLMWRASNAADYHERDESLFIARLSPEFQDAIFRFKYCSHFQYLADDDQKLREINLRLFLF